MVRYMYRRENVLQYSVGYRSIGPDLSCYPVRAFFIMAQAANLTHGFFSSRPCKRALGSFDVHPVSMAATIAHFL